MSTPSVRITRINDVEVPPHRPLRVIEVTGNPKLTACGTVNIPDNTVTCSLSPGTCLQGPPSPAQVQQAQADGNSWSVDFGPQPSGQYCLKCTAPDEPGDEVPINVT